jgi:hypothetical protein
MLNSPPSCFSRGHVLRRKITKKMKNIWIGREHFSITVKGQNWHRCILYAYPTL